MRQAPLGRRDDLEALAYMLLFLRHGRLPWTGLQAPSTDSTCCRAPPLLHLMPQLNYAGGDQEGADGID